MKMTKLLVTAKVHLKIPSGEFDAMTLSQVREHFRKKIETAGFRISEKEQMTIGVIEETTVEVVE